MIIFMKYVMQIDMRYICLYIFGLYMLYHSYIINEKDRLYRLYTNLWSVSIILLQE